MKKIRLTESQYKRLLNESSYTQIQSLVNTKLVSGKGTLSSSELNSISDALYDAIKGMGTDEDAIAAAFNRCNNLHDVKAVFSAFKRNTGEGLMSWLDGDIDRENTWNVYVLRPIRKAYDASIAAGHDKESEAHPVEEKILASFPCLKDTPGYKWYKEDGGRGILYFQAEGGYYGVKPDGTLYNFDDSQNKYVAFPEKTRCVGAQYASIAELNLSELAEYGDVEEAGLNLNPGGAKPEPKPSEDPKPEAGGENPETPKQDGGSTEEKPVVRTRLMTGSDVSEIQKMLHDAGLGEIVGSIDGKLGKKTLAGIKEFLLGANRPQIEKVIALKPKGVKPLDLPKPELKLAETDTLNESQKRFKRLIR